MLVRVAVYSPPGPPGGYTYSAPLLSTSRAAPPAPPSATTVKLVTPGGTGQLAAVPV